MTNKPVSTFNLPRMARTWFRDSIRYRGLLPTATLFLQRLFEFARDLAPARRRLRYGDLQFDFDHRVNTTWSNVTLRTRLREIFSGEPYQPIAPEEFHEALGVLDIDYSRYTFIDLGSGKGRALLLASDYPFRRIIGLEILPELHQISVHNINLYSSSQQRCCHIESRCGDARQFVFPDEPVLLYLFNPFSEPVFQQVLDNLELSLCSHPRPIVLLYVNPLFESLIAERQWLRKQYGTHQFSVFVNG